MRTSGISSPPPHCRSGLLRARWVKGHLDAEAALGRGASPEDRAGNAAADRLAGAAAEARLPSQAMLQLRARQLGALKSVQRVLAMVELAALKANHGGHGPGGPRVRRRWAAAGHRRRRAPREADDAAVAAAAAPVPVPPDVPRPGAAAAARALFVGGTWRLHAASQGPAWVACMV